MSIERILQKEAPQPGTVTGLSGAGLGMAGTKRIHSQIETYLSHILFDDAFRLNYVISNEIRIEEYKKNSQIADVYVGLRDEFGIISDAVILIEICDEATFSEAKDRILKTFKVYPKTMKEAFIYRYDTDKWYKCNNNNFVYNMSYSDVFKRNLDFIIINSYLYYAIVNKKY